MFTRQVTAQVDLLLSNRLEMMIGMFAVQNPRIFYPERDLLLPFETLRDEHRVLLTSIIPTDDLASSEDLLPALIKESTQRAGNTAEAQAVSPELGTLLQKSWELGGERLWGNVEPLYRKWWRDAQPTNTQQVIALAEAAQGTRLADTHRRLLDQARRIVVIPTFLAYPQLGFNPIGDELFLIIGLPASSANSPPRQKQPLPLSVAVGCFAALGDERRMAILHLLLQTESLTGVEMGEKLGITPATVSHHISTLAQNGLINRERRGREVLYAPDRARLAGLAQFLKGLEKEEV